MGPLLRGLGNLLTCLLSREILENFLVKVLGDTLGSLLCICLKRMHEVQRLISTGSRDIHNLTKEEQVIGLRAICTMATFYYFYQNTFRFPFMFKFGSSSEV